ncbi:MAG: Xaa-Pro peptidase family protein [Kiloniellales bacterium]|nr:Xaa-Pro peptidase family protein [Kiloniellales bacterium]
MRALDAFKGHLERQEFLDDLKPIDELAIRSYRLDRVHERLRERDIPGLLLFDPVNIRYATGSRNMQVWTMHNFGRYAFVACDGPVVLSDFSSSSHLSEGLETVDIRRPSISFDYMIVGERGQEMAGRLAAEIADLVRQYGGSNKRLAIDRGDLFVLRALEAEGLDLLDGKAVMEQAKSVKSGEEIRALTRSLRTCEAAVGDMRAALKPGMRESDALALLLKGSVERGGEYPETRLLSSGPRTNPWFQETSDRVMQAGDLLSFDTDLIGPDGFYNDISRSWTVGEERPNDEQRRLYDLSRRQIEQNVSLLRPGLGFLDYARAAFQLPEDCIGNRYADVAHGCGLAVDYPLIWYPEDEEWGAYDGVFEENMVICVESYVGSVGGREGVKLEQPVWITADGPYLLSDYPLEDDWA